MPGRTSALSTRRWGGILIAERRRAYFYERRTPRGTPSHLESLAAANAACVTRGVKVISIAKRIVSMWVQQRLLV